MRDADFTPTTVRFWVQGQIEAGQLPRTDELAPFILVSAGSGQRFMLAAETADGIAWSVAEGTTVTVWGRVTTSEDNRELTLDVEGHSVDAL